MVLFTIFVCLHFTGSCTHVDLGELKGKREDGFYYISQQKSVCFTCPAFQAAAPNLATNSFYWSVGEDKLLINEANSKGKVFQNRTLLIVNSSQTFSTENATRLMCVNNSQSLESQTAVVFLGGTHDLYQYFTFYFKHTAQNCYINFSHYLSLSASLYFSLLVL